MVVYLVWMALAALVAFGAYVRLAPSDPAVWHFDPRLTEPDARTGIILLDDLAVVGIRGLVGSTNNAAMSFVEVPGTPLDVLERLDRIALATPRTKRLLGSPEEGRITWVTRSAIWGFPDYTTAEATVSDVATADLAIVARSRFGRSDLGVNTARLRAWLSQLGAP